ncbi:MAG: PQQ-binding-like beta-propeller repeat protein [Chthonomonadales bacterium]
MSIARNRILNGSRFFAAAGILSVTAGLSAIALISKPAVNAGNVSTLPLSLDWKFTSYPSPLNHAQPVSGGKDVFFTSGTRIYCVNATTGAMHWKYPQDEPLGAAVLGTMAYADGVIYAGSSDGNLIALDAITGRLNWQYDTRSTISNSLTLADGILYFGSGNNKLWAIDIKTHDSLGAWKNGVSLSDEVTGAPIVANGFVYALTLDQVFHAVGSATGKERWQYRVNGSVLHLAPVVNGEYVYIPNGSNITCLLGRTGANRWNQFLRFDVAVTPVIANDTLFVITVDNQLDAYDARTGRRKWKNSVKVPFEVTCAPVASDNHLFVGTTAGGLYAMDTETGNVQWSYKSIPATRTDAVPTQTNVSASPVVNGNSLLVLSDDGSLLSFRADAVDTTPPVISDVEPEMGVVAKGTPPIHIEAKIIDEGSGINPDTVKILIDGEGAAKKPEGKENYDKTGYRFDQEYSILEYDVQAPPAASAVRPLIDGRHTITITATDWRGNVGTKSWNITIDNTVSKSLAKKRPANANSGPGGGNGLPGGKGSGSGGSSGGSRGRPGGGGVGG